MAEVNHDAILRAHLAKERNHNIAKNIIFFLGDGMSIPSLAAARIYLGQMHGQSGEESHLSFETFPYIGLSKVRACKAYNEQTLRPNYNSRLHLLLHFQTYCIDKQVPDSACTATA